MLKFCIAAADILAVLIFALLARLAHSGLTLVTWIDTAWPFLCGTVIGWFVLAMRSHLSDAHSPCQGLIIWICTVATGLTLWGLRHAAVPHWSFIMVAGLMSGFLLIGWRFVVRRASNKKNLNSCSLSCNRGSTRASYSALRRDFAKERDSQYGTARP